MFKGSLEGFSMAKVNLEIEECDLDGDYGTISGLRGSCTKCHHEEEAFGTSEASARKLAVKMKENCPQGESNYYDIGDYE